MNSIARKKRDSNSPKSMAETMFGWFRRALARASRMKRSTNSGSPAREGERIFSATGRAIDTCSARYTEAIVPRPRSLMTR